MKTQQDYRNSNVPSEADCIRLAGDAGDTLSPAAVIAFQFLVDTGTCWRMGEKFARRVVALRTAGILHHPFRSYTARGAAFLRNTAGVIALEFALLSPVILLGGAGALDIYQLAQMKSVTQFTAMAAASAIRRGADPQAVIDGNPPGFGAHYAAPVVVVGETISVSLTAAAPFIFPVLEFKTASVSATAA